MEYKKKAASIISKTKTTCPYCGVGCGIVATVYQGDTVTISGDKTHPANRGKLCVLGGNLGNTLGRKGRLTFPSVNGDRTSMNDALEATAKGFLDTINTYGPDSVAFYGSGQLLTEDYYVANKLMKGFIGSANFDTNSRLCMASSVTGHLRAFGSDIVPGLYEDVELADLTVLIGSNAAWCHPVLFKRIIDARKSNEIGKIVVVDPRQTETSRKADLHLQLKSGTDDILLNGLAVYLDEYGFTDKVFVKDHTQGFDEAIACARSSAPNCSIVAQQCGLRERDVEQFYRWFADTEKTISLFAEGINQSATGANKVNAIINVHLQTGRIGKPGQGPFSITGQPNAMGGREVGGLATQLACHMRLDNSEHRKIVQEFWNSPAIPSKPGYTAIDLFEAVNDGKVKAIWIMGTNPAVSFPNLELVRSALKKCELVVVSDAFEQTDTAAYADILLPAAPWGEKSGTVTNSERCISRMRSFLPQLGEAKPDWWLVKEVAIKMGFSEAFDYESEAEIFREHAKFSGFQNGGTRGFDISSLAAQSYETLGPVTWPISDNPSNDKKRFFEDGKFFTDNKKARFIATESRPPNFSDDSNFPLILNTGRLRDQWHTMTRSARAPKLNAQFFEPLLSVHTEDAKKLSLKNMDVVELASQWGSTLIKCDITDSQRVGEVFVPMHWSASHASHARIGNVVTPTKDPFSHQPEMKHTRVKIRNTLVKWHAVVFVRKPLEEVAFDYWVTSKLAMCQRYIIAGNDPFDNWNEPVRGVLGSQFDQFDQFQLSKLCEKQRQIAVVHNNCLEALLLISTNPIVQPSSKLISYFSDILLPDEFYRNYAVIKKG